MSQAQKQICRKLGLPPDAPEEAVQLRQGYAGLFTSQLPLVHMGALTVLTEKATMGAAAPQVIQADA